jgi:hypothetical protein
MRGSMAASIDTSVPRTGLSVLMNGGGVPKPAAVASFAAMSGMNTDAIYTYQEERERQASALAAAGMVADTVSVAGDMKRIGLEPPPQLASSAAAAPSPGTELDNINWGAMDMGGVHIDNMDLDFATLFDPSIEEASMKAEGNGWPVGTS